MKALDCLKFDIVKILGKKELKRQLELAGNNVIEVLYSVFESFISDEISDFNSSVYYSNPEYLKYSYLEGKLLA